jgi:hypothetical protein
MRSSAKIVLIGVDNESATPEICRAHSFQEIGILRSGGSDLHIPQISRMPLFGSRTSMGRRSTDMPVVTRQLAALSSQIARPVNMKSMFPRWKTRPRHKKADTSFLSLSNSLSLYILLSEYSNGHL